MRIVLDAMGGDYAPKEPVAGAVQALKDFDDIHIILVGDEELINEELTNFTYPNDRITIEHTTEVIGMNEAPATAIRRKRKSSIVVGANLVKKDKGDAFVSAGNTGACMAAGVIKIRPLEGVHRPAIATVLPNVKDGTVMMDAGANVDCKPEELVQFGLMGKVYAEKILKRNNPKVGLLSNGEEKKKGNKLTKETYPLLEETPLNFVGNVEGRDIFNGEVDVVLCDGFVGNIVLKATEGLASAIKSILKEEATSSLRTMIGGKLMGPALDGLKKRLDYTEYGGAPLLGLKKMVIISHGSSNGWAIRNAIRVARESLISGVVDEIEENI